jgi:hypothetical protein
VDKTRIAATVLAALLVFVSVRTATPMLLSVTSFEPSAEIVSVDLQGGKVVEGFNLYAVLRGETTGPYDSFYRRGASAGTVDWHSDSGPNQKLSRETYPGLLFAIPSKDLAAGQRTATVYLRQVSSNGTVLAEDTLEVTFTVLSRTETQSNAQFKSPEWQIKATPTEISALAVNNAEFQDWLLLKVSRSGTIIAHGGSACFVPGAEGTLTVQGNFQSGDVLELWSAATSRQLSAHYVAVSEIQPQDVKDEQGNWLQDYLQSQAAKIDAFATILAVLAAAVAWKKVP